MNILISSFWLSIFLIFNGRVREQFQPLFYKWEYYSKKMVKRQTLSDNYSLYTRKYFLSIVFIVISSFLIWKGAFWLKLFAFGLLAIGLFYLSLRKVEFDSEYVYVGSKRYQFHQLTKFSSIEVNLYIFPYLEINDNGKKRRVITDSGQAGLLRIVIGILIPSLDPRKNVKNFKRLFDTSR